MLCFYAVVVASLAALCSANDLPWWKTAVFYQVYPRSFKDSDGDGVGDLKGITQKAEYLKDAGVTAIWISPIFKSPMADFGYDISDYLDVDPLFGSLQDFQELSKTLQSLDIKLLFDLVPNHSSDEHEWFQQSIKRVHPYTDYYVWQDGKVDSETGQRTPPNNWISVFSGSAWEWNDERNQYYLHQFVKKQPDLNYSNPLVVQEMMDIMRFWLDMGVDGFRVDAVPFIFEDEEFRDEPALPGTSGETFAELNHTYTQNLPRTFEVLKKFADLVFNYSLNDGKQRALFIEAYADLPTTAKYYGLGNQSLMQPFNFQLLTSGNQSTRPRQLKNLIMNWMDAIPEGVAANWVIGNHDNGRIADRYGRGMVDAMNLLTGVLPGVKVTYNGEEIGMENTFIRWDQTVDPSGLLLGPYHYQQGSRDPERTPMQWDDSLSSGFSTNASTWLPVNPNYWWLNVEAQKAAETSHLKVFQAMAKARMDPVLQKGDLTVIVPNEDTLLVVRKLEESVFALVINMGSFIAEYTTQNLFQPHGLDMDMEVVVGSDSSNSNKGSYFKAGSANFTLRPQAAVLLRSSNSTLRLLTTTRQCSPEHDLKPKC